MSAAHQAAAADMARAYVAGDEQARRRIAANCEENGVLSALVFAALADAVREDFIRTMLKAISQ